LVSAQSRDRYYWTNIPCNGIEYMPSDKGIKLSDIIEFGWTPREKAHCLTRRYSGFQGTESYQCRRYFNKSFGTAIFKDEESYYSVKADFEKDNYFDKDTEVEHDIHKRRIRQMTPIECERLQTLPDNYTEGVSDSYRINGCGNGWTVDVIAWLMAGFERSKHPKRKFNFGSL
jgi:site-specific DNA-cytosine methylase